VNRALNIQAKKLLYQEIRIIGPQTGQFLHGPPDCLTVLEFSTEKWALVKTFFLSDNLDPNSYRGLVTRIHKILPRLIHLKHLDLRIPYHSAIDWEWVSICFQFVLKHGRFELLTLGIDADNALEWLIHHSNSLKFVAVYSELFWTHSPQQLSNFRSLLQYAPSQDPANLVCITIGDESIDTIYGFPSLVTCPKGVARWSSEPIKLFLSRSAVFTDGIVNFHIFLETLSDGDLLRNVIDSIARDFPGVRILTFCVDDTMIQNHTPIFSSMLSSLKLIGLRVMYQADNPGTFQRSELMDQWLAGCPTLKWVHFPDGWVHQMDFQAGQWEASDLI
jgi:hypothetical protein